MKFHKINGSTCPKPRESSIEPSEDVTTKGMWWYGGPRAYVRGTHSHSNTRTHTLAHTHARTGSFAVSLWREKRQTIIIARLHAPPPQKLQGANRTFELLLPSQDKRVGGGGGGGGLWHAYYNNNM